MKSLFALCLFLLPFLVCAQTKVQDLVKDGIDLHDRGYYEEALLKYDSALLIEKNHFLATYEKTFTLMHLKRYKAAIDLCQQMLKENKDQKSLGEVYVVYGNALDMLGKNKESIEVYDEGIKGFPNVSMLYFNKAVTLVGLNEYEKASIALKQAVVKNPFHPSSHLQIANLHQSGNRVLTLMADLTFLALEPNSDRSRKSLKRVKELLTAQAKKTGENSYSVDMDISQLLGNTKKKEDNFGSTEMIISLSSAVNVEEKNRNETIVERLHRNLKLVISTLKEGRKDGKGFGWEYYVPFFVAAEKEDQIETLSHLVLATDDDPANNKWLSDNKAKVESFYKWMEAFAWASPSL
ncbi:MAG TPA: tetratricopeptide repeat protein [Flavisolibacter sp.]|nr:tetratricopeptide repeat protein [Flavisolibacter sp.]